MKLKVIFEKHTTKNFFSSGWGASYLLDNKVLFDFGEAEKGFFNNVGLLNINLTEIECVVVSHNRWNHLGGLRKFLEVNSSAEIYLPSPLNQSIFSYSSRQWKIFKQRYKVYKELYTSGIIECRYKGVRTKEQHLIADTEKGLSLIFTCCLSSILELIKKVKESFPEKRIYSLLGGFHLIDQDRRLISYLAEEIKKERVSKIFSGHCSGFEAERIFHQKFGENFHLLKVGDEIEI